jgi:hypothetical protein
MQGSKQSYRQLASFGKRQEYKIISELLNRGYDVYQTLVDDQQIDCIIRGKRGEKPNYVDIQIKARSKECDPKDAARFAGMKIENPRENYFFIFYSEQLNKTWVIPSLDIVNKIGSLNKKGKNRGKYSLNMAGHSARKDVAIGDGITTKRYEKYEGNKGFELLESVLNSKE